MSSQHDNESFNLDFDSVQPQPCYSIKLFPEIDEIQVHKGRKSIARFKMSSFPDEIDFSKVDDISKLLKVVREHGTVGLMQNYSVEVIS